MEKPFKPVAGAPMPVITVEKVGGGQLVTGSADGWQVVFIYRGAHCPLCRKYLGELNTCLDDFAALGVQIVTISADTREKAEAQVQQEGWQFAVVTV